MITVLNTIYKRYFSEEEAIIFTGILVALVVVMMTMGSILAPILWSLIITYLLQGLVNSLERLRVPRNLAVYLVYALFIGVVLVVLLVVLPFMWRSVTSMTTTLPQMLDKLRSLLLTLPQDYPGVFTDEQVDGWMKSLQSEMARYGQMLLGYSFASLTRIVTWMIYTILVPIMVFFMLKDSTKLIDWFKNWLPKHRPVMGQIWREMNDQLSNYVRGKALEMLLVGGCCFILFNWSGLHYRLLLSILVALSIIIPYIGAKLVSIPVLLVAFLQWGISPEFYHLATIYVILLVLDGYLLVPILYSETVFLHPIAIIVAVLVFGSLWGFWGVFFAIPLATFIKATIRAWPVCHQAESK
ncbi:MAG TPA: AI-2E family transporter [Candidatus Acidoferrum sp.]|nr:AI-2E family transporter [Candidatus Acidoferrum sp.]